MGYDIHITRGRDWANSFDDPDAKISASEWLEYVDADPELSLAGYNGDHFALWSGESEHDDPWFDWVDGVIYTKNPDEPLIDKAVAIAHALGGRVIGEEDEVYLGGGQTKYASEMGGFYVRTDICTGCGLVHDMAPSIMGWDKRQEYPICRFKHQPSSPAEVDEAIQAAQVSEVQAIRYGGSDPEVIRKMQEAGCAGCCDQLTPPDPPAARRTSRRRQLKPKRSWWRRLFGP
ncbi:MAG: ferredoxin [Planctomycetota bacterium]